MMSSYLANSKGEMVSGNCRVTVAPFRSQQAVVCCCTIGQPKRAPNTHTIHGTGIYLHLPWKLTIHVGKYTSPMGWYGLSTFKRTVFPFEDSNQSLDMLPFGRWFQPCQDRQWRATKIDPWLFNKEFPWPKDNKNCMVVCRGETLTPVLWRR